MQWRLDLSDIHGDTVVLSFWEAHRRCVFYVCVVDTYSDSYDSRHPHKILSQDKWHKKGKYLEACLAQRFYFMQIVISVDGVMGEEKNTATKQLYYDLLKNGTGNIRKHVGMSGTIST